MANATDELKNALTLLADNAYQSNGEIENIGTKIVLIRLVVDAGSKIIESLAIKAASESLLIDGEGNISTKSINDFVNGKLEGSGLVVTDIFNKTKTKADISKFATKKINESLPSGLKFRSMARQDINRGVKNYVKSAVKKAALERAGELILDDDHEVAAMIASYNDGRGVAVANDDDRTNAERQATFRATHSYSWKVK